jgi:hypothetical protein
MRLLRARVQNYRSIRDSGWFDVEPGKSILVGPNEAGKTVLLQALQRLNAPPDIRGFDALRDYPRSEYNDISTGRVKPESTDVATGLFALDPDDISIVGEDFEGATYSYTRRLDNSAHHRIDGGPEMTTFGDISRDLDRLAAHADKAAKRDESITVEALPSARLRQITSEWEGSYEIRSERGTELENWLQETLPFVAEDNITEGKRYERLVAAARVADRRQKALKALSDRRPLFVFFNNYFRVRPRIHLAHLADRADQDLLDEASYDYGNLCLLKLLGFTPRELSDLGNAPAPPQGDLDALKAYQDQLDKRKFQLNAASVRLTTEINKVWNPIRERDEAQKLRVSADQQYLKVDVEDELGVEIELDQRSEGYQWLVSFFVVFFAEAADKHENAVLLLDEPGLSLHGLKQRDFRTTISTLSKSNQTLFTTHSPFLVGPDELDQVRVVEMIDPEVGTKVHTTISSEDPSALLPLQEALGYDLAQSLFAQQRNLILEGLTDYWYLEATSALLRDSGDADLNQKIALVSADAAGKVAYYATILHAHHLKVAALLDSDAAGESAAKQDTLVHNLGNKRILRTKDFVEVSRAEIEDLLRETLVAVAKEELGWEVSTVVRDQPNRPIARIFDSEIKDFSKYKLAKAFIRWTRSHDASDLTDDERASWTKLIEAVNKALK